MRHGPGTILIYFMMDCGGRTQRASKELCYSDIPRAGRCPCYLLLPTLSGL
jgi:hypothetical protein